MLATGKSWKKSRTALDNGKFSLDLVKDFIDYLFLDQSLANIKEKIGFINFNLQIDKNTKRLEIREKLPKKTQLKYEIETYSEKKHETKHSLGLEKSLNKNMFIEGETAITKNNSTEKNQVNNKISLKWKNEF